MRNSILFIFAAILIFISCKKTNEEIAPPSTLLTIPILSTVTVSDMTPTGAISGGDISSTGGSDVHSKGVCWSTSPSPTVFDFASSDGGNPSNYVSYLTELTLNTTYYVRAYATNSIGTGYGNEYSFVARFEFPGEKISVAGGSFQMGSVVFPAQADEGPVHPVTVDGFMISKYEITNAQYAKFMNAKGLSSSNSYFSSSAKIFYSGGEYKSMNGEETKPMIHVSWFGAKAYAEFYDGRLPTEAEWDFAARGGNSTNHYDYSGSNNVGDVSWYKINANEKVQPVGSRGANELGIYDMSGNVWEWCNDYYQNDYYTVSPVYNPQGPTSGTHHVKRGGSIMQDDLYVRIPNRYRELTATTGRSLGFRPVF